MKKIYPIFMLFLTSHITLPADQPCQNIFSTLSALSHRYYQRPSAILLDSATSLAATAMVATACVNLIPWKGHTYWSWQERQTDTGAADAISQEKIDATITNWTSYHGIMSPPDEREPFLFGVGTSSLQVDAGHSPRTSAWCQWLEHKIHQDPTCDCVLPGIGCDAQARYKEDVQLIKKLGASAYRFSTSWSLVQPQGPDTWDTSVLNYYINLCDELVANGIHPVITLHHYDDPIWFLDQYNGFETSAGIDAYVAYCSKIYDTLKDHGVHLWLTFNSPGAYAINGYMEGSRPPGYKGCKNIPRVRAVTYGMLQAHKRAYQTIHAMARAASDTPNVHPPRVGILKNIYQIDPWRYSCGPFTLYNPLDIVGAYMAYLVQDELFFTFFTHNQDCLDFIGLNYYSHGFIKNFKTFADPSEIATLNQRNTISAEGLYRALNTLWNKVGKPLGIPIYVTENGIGSGDDDASRALFLRRYLYAITQAVQDGIPVKGYFYWSLMDNYEWGLYKKQYGLYAVDRSPTDNGVPTLNRHLRPGAQPFVDAATSYRKDFLRWQGSIV